MINKEKAVELYRRCATLLPSDIADGLKKALELEDSRSAKEVLKTISVVLCPWSGTYGFRSRLIEVMALGVPVVATPQAVFGMDVTENQGIFLEETPTELANSALMLLRGSDILKKQSALARKQVEEKFSYEVTYGHLAGDLFETTTNRSVDK